MFRKIREIALDAGLQVNIKLWYAPVTNHFKYWTLYLIKRVMHRKGLLSLSELNEEIFTNQVLSPSEFRQAINASDVILDTSNDYQDGLTARFMWALGMGKKIITTNESVKEYPFYNPQQVFILRDDNYDKVIQFIKSPFVMSEEDKKIISQYRIDNWLNSLLEK